MKYKRILLKLSGESLKEENDGILSSSFINSFCNQITYLVSEGIEIGVVIGGGNIWRGRISSDLGMDRSSADWMGMLATVINSLSFKAVLEKHGQKAIVMNSFNIDNCGEKLDAKKAINLLEKGTVVIFGGGTGKTHLSTDTAAAMRANDIQAEVILMAKNNAEGVFDKDPNKYEDAKLFETITYQKVLDLNLAVIDKEAIDILINSKIKTIVFNLNNKDSIIKTIKGETQITTITN